MWGLKARHLGKILGLKAKRDKEKEVIQSGEAKLIFNTKFASVHDNMGPNQQTYLLDSILPFTK